MQTRLMRSETERMIAGVCGGLAEYLGVDPVLVRLAFVILALASGLGLVIYAILWVVMPAHGQPLVRLVDGADDPAAYKGRSNSAATVGVILMLFGAFFLFSQFGWLDSRFWPVLLIMAGLFFIIRRAR